MNGKDADPLFAWLKEEKVVPFGKRIEWNFTKFLIDQNGQVIKRYSSKTDPKLIEEDLKALLG